MQVIFMINDQIIKWTFSHASSTIIVFSFDEITWIEQAIYAETIFWPHMRCAANKHGPGQVALSNPKLYECTVAQEWDAL